jgi:hypothetical protein
MQDAKTPLPFPAAGLATTEMFRFAAYGFTMRLRPLPMAFLKP